MGNSIKVACVQMTSGQVIEESLSQAEGFIREAAKKGATFISTPENTDMINSSVRESLERARIEDEHPGLPFFSSLAKELNIWLHIGSLKIKLDRKLANRSYLFSPSGDITARYNKIHLFDVDLPTGERHRESSDIEAGRQAHVTQAGSFKLGLSICYDLRFPHLYRDMAKAGAEVLVIPAAFTVPTGQAHWHVLQRARAIENGAFVISAAQCGQHYEGRRTFGHSLIINPWGEILADGGEQPGVILADIDLEEVARARAAIPCLQHDVEYDLNNV